MTTDSYDANALKPSDATRAIATAIAARQPIFLWGPPGIGKSSIVEQEAASRGNCLTVILSQMDPVDLRGLPYVDQETKRAAWATPDFLPYVERDGEHGTLFLDELPNAHKSVQTAAMQLTLARTLGAYTVPEGWAVIAAGNRRQDRAAAGAVPSALLNRFAPHIDVRPDLEDWCSWALSNDVRPEVVAFVRFKPGMLFDFRPEADARAFPTPRSWEKLSRLLDAAPPSGLEIPIFAGTVGQGAAGEFLAFLRTWRQLPNPDAVLLDPDGSAVPTEPSTLYALSGALAARATPQNVDRLARYVGRMPPEFGVVTMRDASRRDPDVISTAAFIGWMADNHALMS
jgi:hypothetical protein